MSTKLIIEIEDGAVSCDAQYDEGTDQESVMIGIVIAEYVKELVSNDELWEEAVEGITEALQENVH